MIFISSRHHVWLELLRATAARGTGQHVHVGDAIPRLISLVPCFAWSHTGGLYR